MLLKDRSVALLRLCSLPALMARPRAGCGPAPVSALLACPPLFFHAQYKYPPTTVTIFGYDFNNRKTLSDDQGCTTPVAQQLPSPRRLGYMLLALLALFTASSTSEYVDLGSGLGCNTSAEVALASTRLYLYTQLPEVAGRLEPCSTREPRHIRYGSTLSRL